MQKCNVCRIHKAIFDAVFGYLPCSSCQSRRNKQSLPTSSNYEFTSENIKKERKQFGKDIIQPFRAGDVSKEFIDTYGRSGIGITDKEAKKAKNVWR